MASSALSGAGVGRVLKELKELLKRPEEGIRVFLNEDNIADIEAEFDGPEGTPFAGGLFRMRLSLGPDYPQSPPKGCFLTKIFHPNISKAGEVCVNVLKRDWQPDLGLRHVLLVIRCLLIEPFPESALNEEAGRLLLDDYEDYARHARLMTSIHASRRQMPLSAEAGANAVNAQEPAEQQQSGDSGTAVKKPKGVEKAKAAAAKKRSLKRL